MDTLHLYTINLNTKENIPDQLMSIKLNSIRKGYDNDLFRLSNTINWDMIEYLNVSTIQMGRYDMLDVSLPRLPNNLKVLDCSFTKDIMAIPKIPDSCKALICNSCRSLESLPEMPKNIKYIDCSFCIGIKTLPDFNHNLISFNCLNIPLNRLPKFKEGLKVLKISLIHGADMSNELPDSIEELTWKGEYLDRLPKNTKVFNCNHGLIEKLPDLTTGKLEELQCSGNILTKIRNLPTTLKKLSCNYNKLTLIDKLPESLEELNCHHNNLVMLPSLNENLRVLSCSYNNIVCLPSFPRTLEKVFCHKNKVTLFPKSVTTCDNLVKVIMDKKVLLGKDVVGYLKRNKVKVDFI